ncbi:MAG TPA: hypothetical protein DD713_05345 [Nitrospiraceae bacterium]|nr:hypothetical protein [Nitrospiraceae bacterium]
MIYYLAALLNIFNFYRKCPRCKKVQHFTDKKKGDSVTCKKCGHEFVLQ